MNPTSKHAITGVIASLLRYSGVRIAAILTGVHGDGHKLGVLAGNAGRLNEGPGSGRQVEAVGRHQSFRFQHVFYEVIVRVQNLAGYGPRPLRLFEYVGRRPESDVKVMERAAADSRALNDVYFSEDFVFEESIGAAGLPPGLSYLADRSGESQAIPLLAALKDADRSAALGEAAC